MPDSKSGWIGVDLDKTLAYHSDFELTDDIGEPLPEMVKKVKHWLDQGLEVRIMTARVGLSDKHDANRVAQQRKRIAAWTLKHIGQELEVTSSKDYQMLVLYDDRAVQVIPNTGLTKDEFESD